MSLKPRLSALKCPVCRTLFQGQRSTKVYCSDACRKAAKRATDQNHSARELEIRDHLMSIGFIGPLWPVYPSESRRVIALLVPRATAAAELAISDDNLARVLRNLGIIEGNIDRLIKDHYAARRNRRVDREEALAGQNPVDRLTSTAPAFVSA